MHALYLSHKILEDDGIRNLTPEDFRIFIGLVVLMARDGRRGQVSGFSDDELAQQLSCDVEAMQSALSVFKRLGLILTPSPGLIVCSSKLVIFRSYSELMRPKDEAWKRTKKKVLDRDNRQCQYCGVVGVPMEVDHVVPLSEGGSNEMSNLLTACSRCNGSKSARTPGQWRGARKVA